MYEYTDKYGNTVKGSPGERIVKGPSPEEVHKDMVEQARPRCSIHTSYQGATKPKRDDCLKCWKVYFRRHVDEPITGQTMAKMLMAIEITITRSASTTHHDVLTTLTEILRREIHDDYD